MATTSNKNAYSQVMAKEKFTASNMFAEWITCWNDDVRNELYVVYSYGRHFPMWIWDKNVGQWIGNKEKYSRSTSRQQSQTKPANVNTYLDEAHEMNKLIGRGGLVGYMAVKAQGER